MTPLVLEAAYLRETVAVLERQLSGLRAAVRADYLLTRGDDSAWNALPADAVAVYQAALAGVVVAADI